MKNGLESHKIWMNCRFAKATEVYIYALLKNDRHTPKKKTKKWGKNGCKTSLNTFCLSIGIRWYDFKVNKYGAVIRLT